MGIEKQAQVDEILEHSCALNSQFHIHLCYHQFGHASFQPGNATHKVFEEGCLAWTGDFVNTAFVG